jgi:hypothetical protein
VENTDNKTHIIVRKPDYRKKNQPYTKFLVTQSIQMNTTMYAYFTKEKIIPFSNTF